jgi:DNA-binding protein HU-beta
VENPRAAGETGNDVRFRASAQSPSLEDHQHMNRRELAKAISGHTGQSPRDVDNTLQGFIEVISSTVSGGEPVAISGFAKFVKVDRPARMGRNPATGESIQIKASKKVRITPLKAFKDVVMSGSAPRILTNAWPPAPSPVVAAAAPRKAAPAKKAAAKKKAAPARKAAAKKKAPAKKAPAKKKAAAAKKKAPARKAPARKAPARKATGRRR